MVSDQSRMVSAFDEIGNSSLIGQVFYDVDFLTGIDERDQIVMKVRSSSAEIIIKNGYY